MHTIILVKSRLGVENCELGLEDNRYRYAIFTWVLQAN
jgi:hypothetical protein